MMEEENFKEIGNFTVSFPVQSPKNLTLAITTCRHARVTKLNPKEG